MTPSDIESKIKAKIYRLDEARQEKSRWLIGRLQALAQSERSESIRNCYWQLIRQVEMGVTLALPPSLASLEDSQRKAVLLDLKETLALWANIKSMASRAKIQVNVQISRDAKDALKDLAARERISQGEVIEALLLKNRKRSGRKRTFERTPPLPSMPTEGNAGNGDS